MKTLLPYLPFLLSLLLGLASCGQQAKVPGFDSDLWKADPQGCKGHRAQVWKQFGPDKGNLIGFSENNLAELLGPPDAKNLLEKGQKTYSYYVAGSPSCQPGQKRQQLQVRVNVTGKVSEAQLVYD